MKLPKTISEKISSLPADSKELDARFKYRGYTKVTRKDERKQKRLEKKQSRHQRFVKKPSVVEVVQPAVREQPIAKKPRVDSKKSKVAVKEPVLQSSTFAFDQDDQDIAFYAKKLGIKRNKTPQTLSTLQEDGLGDLFDDLDVILQGGASSLASDASSLASEDEASEDEASKDLGSAVESESEKLYDSASEDEQSELEDLNQDTSATAALESDKDTSDNVLESIKKYVPPHLREKGDERLKKQLQGLLNKLTESNIESIVSSMQQVFVQYPRKEFIEQLTEMITKATANPQLQLLDSFCQLHAALLVLVSQSFAGQEFAAFFVEKLVEKVAERSSVCANLITFLSFLYNFGMIHCTLIYDFIREFIQELNELNVDLLLKILRTSGHKLRQDDPSSLKEIVLQVTRVFNEMDQSDLTFRCKFMIETIQDLKNNKRKKVENLFLDRLKKIIKVEPLRFSLDDLRNSSEKGKWWLVGSAWKGREVVQNTSLDNELEQLARAQGMNTDVRRAIFSVLMSSEDCIDCFERLMKLGLKEKQQREIVRVLIHCCAQEKAFNPFYGFVGLKLCEYSHSFKITFQFAFWDFLKEISDLDSNSIRKVCNLAKMLAFLLEKQALNLVVLRILDFTLLLKAQVLFNQIVFGLLLDRCDQEFIMRSLLIDKQAPFTASLNQGIALFLQQHFIQKIDSGIFDSLLKSKSRVLELAINLKRQLSE